MRDALAGLTHLGRGHIRGHLYDLGSYPGAISDDQADSWVVGEVHRLPPDESVLERFDRYEGFDPTAPADSLFRRVPCTVQLEDGGRVDSWVYVYNGDPAEAPRVPGGDFRTHYGQQGDRAEHPTARRPGHG